MEGLLQILQATKQMVGGRTTISLLYSSSVKFFVVLTGNAVNFTSNPLKGMLSLLSASHCTFYLL